VASRTFPAWPDSVPEARRYVSESLDRVPPQLCQTAALLVSELATNVVRHTGAGEFVIELEHDPAEGKVWIGVTDSGTGLPILRAPSLTAEHGRGMQLVSTLADRWGAGRRRGATDKTVWFELRYG
jgi:anti-sigma regulatory factor (Ser/Thr protein kinase)